MSVAVVRLRASPIVTRASSASLGENINGPSLVAAPPWLERPLGRYYLYFAHHRGSSIRLATADALEGPWRIYEPGTLSLAQSGFPTVGRRPHIASPDVHLDHETQTVRMYVHGLLADGRRQATRVALSHDGLEFEARPELLGRPYLRAFRRGECWYALAKPGILYRSRDGLAGFERGPVLFPRSMRHSALVVDRGELAVFWTRIGDEPERILLSRIALDGDWRGWRRSETELVLEPQLPWEGAALPLRPSRRGWVDEPVRELRDPAVFCERGRTYLLYAVAGESGIAIAELALDGDGERLRRAAAHETVGPVVISRPEPARDTERDPAPALGAASAGDRLWRGSERVLAFVNRRHTTAYRLTRRLREPEDGAYLLAGVDGAAVLKWSPDRSNEARQAAFAARVDSARAFGWPLPRWRAAGLTPGGYPYRVEEVGGGSAPARLDRELAAAAVELVESQAGRAEPDGRDWWRHDRDVVFAGADGLAERLAGWSLAGRRFARTLLALAEPAREARPLGADLVHGRLRLERLRLEGGRVVAVFDVEQLGTGSRFHDLATLVAWAALGEPDGEAEALILDRDRDRDRGGERELARAAALMGVLALRIERRPEQADVAIARAGAFLDRHGLRG